LTEPYDTKQYTAGIKLSKSNKTASVVLLEWTGQDSSIVGYKTLTCSNNLQEVIDWLEQHLNGADVEVAAGVDSSSLRYLNIQIPVVDEKQRHGLLKTQAEAKLPLSADQMSLAWQTHQNGRGLHCRTAVIRKQLLQSILSQSDRIGTICPEAVGLAAVWKRYSRSGHQRGILLYRREKDILSAFVQDGHIQSSSVIDADGADLRDGSPAGLLMHDIQAELEIIESETREKMPVVILSETPADEFLSQLCAHIQDGGRTCEIEYLQDVQNSASVTEMEALGLALEAKAGAPIDFDFRAVEQIGQSAQEDTKAGLGLRKAILITLALLILVLASSYWKTKKDVALMDKVMSSSHEDLTVQQVLDEQSYRETIARARPDLIDLFTRIQKCQKNILLDTLEFEKGKPVKLTATAQSYDAAFEFQKELEAQNKNVIKSAQLLEPRKDAKGEKVRFTLTFQYLNFSK
jgi:hypothetical protein